MKTAVNLIVVGSLYKSGFRFYAQKKGIELGLFGTISYHGEYGDVSIHAEGDETAVKQFTDWCAKGLPYCKVQRVDIQVVQPLNFQSFDIVSTKQDSTDEVDDNKKSKKDNLGSRIFGF